MSKGYELKFLKRGAEHFFMHLLAICVPTFEKYQFNFENAEKY